MGESEEFSTEDGDTDGDGRDFRGQQRTNDTHASKTDPDARLYRRSNQAESRLAYLGHLLIENRHRLIVDAMAQRRRRLCRTRGGDADDAEAVARGSCPPHARVPCIAASIKAHRNHSEPRRVIRP